jgi:hypothetical protein
MTMRRFGAVAAATAILLTACNLGAPPVHYVIDTNAGPATVATGDFDRDGDLDVVVAKGDGGFSDLLNRGDGSYFSIDGFTALVRIDRVVPADIDDDGDLDLLVGGPTDVPSVSPVVALLLGDGNGGFGPDTVIQTSVSGSAGPVVAAGDVNGDGHLDLVFGAAGLGVRLGDGTGAFGTPTFHSFSSGFVSATAEQILLDDVDGDGDLDALVAAFTVGPGPFSPESDQLFVLTNDGTGTFARTSDVLAGGTESVTLADFDEDGHDDLVFGGSFFFSDQLALNRSDGAGGFLPPEVIANGENACGIAAGDFDADGHQDVVIANGDTGGRVLFGNGAGGFGDFHPLKTTNEALTGPCNAVVAGNLDGEARPDVVFASGDRDDVTVMLNRLDGRTH